MPKPFFFFFLIWQETVIYAGSISGPALIFTVCLNFVHKLQFNFKYGFRPAFPSPLQQNFEVVAAFFFLDIFKA